MSAGHIRVENRSERWVLAWVDRYTRGVPDAAATDRREEVVSDLWEQESAARQGGQSGPKTAISIVSRAARGVLADLSWRRAQLAGRTPQPFGVRAASWMVPAGFVLAVLVGLVVTAVGVVVLSRVGVVVARHQFPPSDTTVLSTGLGTAAVVCGLLLMARSRTRWLGAVWLAAATAVVLYFGAIALVTVSATAQALAVSILGYPMAPIGQPAVVAAIAAVSVFYLALAIAWIPRREVAR